MEAKIIELIADKLCKKKEQITLDAKLVEDLGADSLDVVELIMAFEKTNLRHSYAPKFLHSI